MKRRSFLIGGGALVALAPIAANAQAPTNARDLMARNFLLPKISSFRSSGKMLLINDRGERRERRTTGYSILQPNGVDSKILVRFTFPPDVNGTAFLQIEHSEGEDDQWIYLPALGKSRRLVANNKKDSFVGSDFSYGDISLPKVDLYEHRLIGSEIVDERDCHKIESTPKTDRTKADSGYSRKISWLRKDTLFEGKVEYYDIAGRLLKVQRIGEARLIEPDKGRYFAIRREMTNVQTGHKTVIETDQVELVRNLRDDMFTTRALERGQ